MNYVKMLGLAAMVPAVLMAFVGASTASATVLCTQAGTGTATGTTCPQGWAYGGEIHMVSEERPVTTGGFKNIECEESTKSFVPENGGESKAEEGEVTGPVEVLTSGGCNCSVNVIEKGSLSISWIKNTHNGTLKSTGLTETVSCSTIFGNVHCAYKTNNTDIGTLTGSATTGGTATVDITAEIPREATSSLCSENPIWHAKYKVTTPDILDVTGET